MIFNVEHVDTASLVEIAAKEFEYEFTSFM
jgi:hypothetical protein